MNTASLSPTRALYRPRRLDWRVVTGLLIILLAIGGSIAFWTTTSDTRTVLIARRNLPGGSILTLSDVAIARVRVDDAIYQAAIPASSVQNVIGKQIDGPAYAHQILVRSQFSTRPPLSPGHVALTIPISPETAVGGTLQVGDSVEVFLTTNKGKPDAQTTVVLPHTTIYGVGHAQPIGAINTGIGDGSASLGPVKWLTLVVTPDQAAQLARARWAGELDVALLPPAQGSENAGNGRTRSGH